MPRRRRTRRASPGSGPGPLGSGQLGLGRPDTAAVVEERSGRTWHVRRLNGASSSKAYTCPACSRPIRPGTAHVVAWPVEKSLLSESALDERRHWHRDCWSRLA